MRSKILWASMTLVAVTALTRQSTADGVQSSAADRDGLHYLTLENRHVQMEFIPAQGGICSRFEIKGWTGDNNATLLLDPASGCTGGLLEDWFVSPRLKFNTNEYLYEITGDASRKSLHLWTTGTRDLMYLRLHKTITLDRDSSEVGVVYEFKNSPESYTDYEIAVQFHNFLGLRGEPNNYYFPMADGVHTLTYDLAKGKFAKGREAEALKSYPDLGNEFPNPVRGWSAVVGETSRHGVAIDFDYEYLDSFYCWTSLELSTFEAFSRKTVIPQGGSLTIGFSLYPFQGVSRVDGVIDGIVCSIEGNNRIGEDSLGSYEIKLHAAEKKTVRLTTRLKRLGHDDWREIASDEYELAAGKIRAIPVAVAGDRPGKIVLNLQIEHDGRIIGDAERLITVGDGGPEKYVRKPVAPRAGKSRVEKSGTQATGRELSMELVTPHEKWATPYCRGTIRALVLTNHMQQREIVELAQRLDMEFDTVELSLPSQYRYFTKIGNLKNAQTLLLRYLQENQYDVMVIGGIPWNRYFNADIHKEIEQQVTAGMGLIYVSPLDLDEVGQSMVPLAGGTPMGTRPPAGKWEKIADHWLVNGFDFRIFPLSSNCHYQPTDDAELLANVEDTYPLIAVKRHGNGRVIGLGYDALTHNVDYDHIFTSGLTPRLMVPHYGGKYAGMSCQPEKELRYRYWEYYFAFLSRCVAWAADKASDIDITTFEWSADGTALSIVLDNAGDETAGSLALTLKNKYAEQIEAIARDVVLKTGRNKIEVPVSARAPHGMNFAELIVRNSNAKALNWGVAALPVAHEKFIVGLRFAKESFAAGENIEGTITLDGAAAGKYKLVLRLFDLHGRLLADREAEEMVAAGKSEQPFSLASTRAVAEAGRVEARLFQAGIQRDLVKEDVAITTPYDPRAFYLSGWISRFGSYYLRQMNMAEMLGIGYSAATIDGWMIPHWRPQGYKLIINYAIRMHMERSDEADVMAQYLKTKDKTVLVRKPSFSDPEFLEKCQQRLRNVARTAVNFGGALNYGIGDENRIGAWADFSPHNLAAYRAWLKQEYQNLEALNREWESTYADWDEITPATEQDARTTGQYPPWLTHRQFTERSLTAFLQTCRKTVKAADPPAELHISGTMGATVEAGTDWIQLAKILDVKGYNEWWILGEVFRCFLEKRNQPYVYHYPHMWKVLFHGATGGIGNWCSPALSLAPDFSWTKDGKERRRFMDKAVETGLPRFLQDATRDNSRIALHYSRLSRLATYISGPSSGDKHLEPWEDNVRAWCNLLEDLGFQYDLLSHEQLAEDALQPEAYKLLILPQSTAIYPVELEKIKAYVAAGGTVAANGGTAEFNHHGARLARGALDEVFGVEKGDQGGERVSLKDYRLDVQLLDKDLKTRPGAELVASDKPAMIRNQVGKGKAVYLNFNLNNYNSFIKKRSHNLRIRGYRDLLAGIFAEAGIKAGFSIRSVDNAPLRTEIVAYRSGEATVLAVFYWRQEDSANVAADIVFDGRYHVYDIEKSEYLGHRNEVRTTFEAQGPIHLPTDFRCYALLPVKPGNLDLRVDAEIKPGSELNFSAALPADIKGGTSIAIDVVDPTGMSRRHYRRSLQINYDGDAGRGKIQLALNDPPGRWKIVARDILSGSAAQATFDITR